MEKGFGKGPGEQKVKQAKGEKVIHQEKCRWMRKEHQPKQSTESRWTIDTGGISSLIQSKNISNMLKEFSAQEPHAVCQVLHGGLAYFLVRPLWLFQRASTVWGVNMDSFPLKDTEFMCITSTLKTKITVNGNSQEGCFRNVFYCLITDYKRTHSLREQDQCSSIVCIKCWHLNTEENQCKFLEGHILMHSLNN